MCKGVKTRNRNIFQINFDQTILLKKIWYIYVLIVQNISPASTYAQLGQLFVIPSGGHLTEDFTIESPKTDYQRFLCSSEMLIHGFWGFKMLKCSVGMESVQSKKRDQNVWQPQTRPIFFNFKHLQFPLGWMFFFLGFGGIPGSASRVEFLVSLNNHVGFMPWLLNSSSTPHSPEIYIHLKTGWAQNAWLKWTDDSILE